MLDGTGVRPARKLPFYDHIPLRWAMSLATHGLVVESVGLWLFSRMRQHHARIRAQRSTWMRVCLSDISEGTGIDQRHIREAISVLEKYGFLVSEATRKGTPRDPTWTLMLDFPYEHVRYFTEGARIESCESSSGYELFGSVSIEEHNLAMTGGKMASVMHWALILLKHGVIRFRLATSGIPVRTQYNGLAGIRRVMPGYFRNHAKLPRIAFIEPDVQRYALQAPWLAG